VSVLLWICGETTLEQYAKKNGLNKIWHYDAANNKWTYHQNHSDNTNNVGGQPSGRLTTIQPNKTYWIQSPRYQVISRAGGINSVKYFIHNNHLGSVALTTDVNGVVKQGSEYLPYGAPANAQDSKLQPYGFSAKERDASELMYFEARYYDPLSTRFISPDPLFAVEMEKCIESIVECNLYQYTGNNPLVRVDLSGLFGLTLMGSGVAETGAGVGVSANLGVWVAFGIDEKGITLAGGTFGSAEGGSHIGVTAPQAGVELAAMLSEDFTETTEGAFMTVGGSGGPVLGRVGGEIISTLPAPGKESVQGGSISIMGGAPSGPVDAHVRTGGGVSKTLIGGKLEFSDVGDFFSAIGYAIDSIAGQFSDNLANPPVTGNENE
jgi:RHS repeat-associated protein